MWPFKRTLSEQYSKFVKLIKSIDPNFQMTENKEDSLRLHLPNYKGNQPMDFHIYLMEPFLFISFITEIEGEKISCLNNFPQDTDQQDMFNLAMSNNLNKIHQVLEDKHSEDGEEKKDDGKEETDGNHNSVTSNNDSSDETWGLRDYYDFNESFKKHALTIMILRRGIEFRYFASKNDNYLQNEYYFLNFNLSNSFSNNGNTDDILTCDLISAPNIYKKSLILEKKIEFFTDEPIGNLIFSFNYFLKSTGDLLFIDTPIFEYLYFNNYDYYRKYDLLDYVDFNRDLFYLILNFDNNLSSIYINQFLNWVYQFISSDLNRSDRIELLRYSEFIFLELNKFKIFDNEYIEWIVKLVINKQFFEASVVVDLIHLKNKSIMNNDVDSKIRMFEKLFNTNYKFEEIFYVDSNIIDFNNKLADIKLNHDFLNRFRLNSEIMKAINLIKKWNLFDEKFYNLKYGYEGNLNPLLHYIFIGFKEGKNPSLIFDGYY